MSDIARNGGRGAYPCHLLAIFQVPKINKFILQTLNVGMCFGNFCHHYHQNFNFSIIIINITIFKPMALQYQSIFSSARSSLCFCALLYIIQIHSRPLLKIFTTPVPLNHKLTFLEGFKMFL